MHWVTHPAPAVPLLPLLPAGTGSTPEPRAPSTSMEALLDSCGKVLLPQVQQRRHTQRQSRALSLEQL